MITPIVELRNATKKYGGVSAIQNIDFALLPGEIHTLVGENGDGKSTLTKVMAGVVDLTSGQMLVEGREVNPRTPVQARELGIAMVFQETSLVPTMTVAQNLFLGQERYFNRLRGIYIAAQQFLQSLQFDVDPTTTELTAQIDPHAFAELAAAENLHVGADHRVASDFDLLANIGGRRIDDRHSRIHQPAVNRGPDFGFHLCQLLE